MVLASGGVVEDCPTAVFPQDRAHVVPGRWILQSVFGEHAADRVRTEHRVDIVRSDDLKARAVHQLDAHFIFPALGDDLRGEVRHERKAFTITSLPQDLFALGIGREDVEIRAYSLECSLSAVVDEGLFFAGTPMPDSDNALDAATQRFQYWELVGTGREVVRYLYLT